VEALTFAEQVVVMTRGRAVQVGSAADLFERPSHTFVGHFIGSPGMNFLPGSMTAAGFHTLGATVAVPAKQGLPDGAYKLGVRPEYVSLAAAHAEGALPMAVSQVQDVGTHVIVSAQREGVTLKARLSGNTHSPAVGDNVWLQVMGAHTCFYQNEEIVG
jgi:glycerol transport system ATP-binding protein